MTLMMPDEEMQKLIRKELNEDVNTRDEFLQKIKEWLVQEPHLPDTWDERAILSFLRGCSFSLEKCKRKLDLYFTTRAAAPEFFSNRDISKPELEIITKFTHLPTLPGLTPEGRRVTIYAGKDKSVTSPLAEDAFKIVFMIGDVRLVEEQHGVAGDVIILDADVMTPTHFGKVTPSLMKRFFTCVEDAYPVKLKEVHVINVHPLIQIIFTWIKPLAKEKLISRIHLHSDGFECLYKFVPKDILPNEYGGTGGTLQELHDAWIKKLEEYTPWFQKQENIKADLSKRPAKCTDYDQLFGMDGSFRKLTID